MPCVSSSFFLASRLKHRYLSSQYSTFQITSPSNSNPFTLSSNPLLYSSSGFWLSFWVTRPHIVDTNAMISPPIKSSFLVMSFLTNPPFLFPVQLLLVTKIMLFMKKALLWPSSLTTPSLHILTHLAPAHLLVMDQCLAQLHNPQKLPVHSLSLSITPLLPRLGLLQAQFPHPHPNTAQYPHPTPLHIPVPLFPILPSSHSDPVPTTGPTSHGPLSPTSNSAIPTHQLFT